VGIEEEEEMPLSPAPMLPGLSPLPDPRGRPPSRRALRIGAFSAVPVLVALLAVGQLFLPQLLFLVPGLQAQANTLGGGGDGTSTASGATFQGFVYNWTRDMAKNAPQGSGFNQPASLQNMQFEAGTFHMNTIIIPVVADMPDRSNSPLYWHSSDGSDSSTLSDADYVDAIKDAVKAHLVPILELQVRQHNATVNGGNDSATQVGTAWDLQSNVQIGVGNGEQTVGALEQAWFDNYTAFAAHYAQMSQQYHLPYFIIGDQLANVTVESDYTTRKADPRGIINVPGDPSCPGTAGRRECEWRHVIHAITSAGYATINGHHSQTGGGYSGKLIYAAYWGKPAEGVTVSEFDHIGWWDAVAYIGVDAFFPLTQNLQDVPVQALENAWNGQFSPQGGAGDIVGSLQRLSDTYKKQVVFTAAGYASVAGSNSHDGPSDGSTPNNDEQLNDMQALLQTFTPLPWWAGAFWSADEPIVPRESQPNWKVSSTWAGNTLQSSKPAGQWLAGYYQPEPMACNCG
jgi:hypothetical protein